jgi:hypothetical protein
MAAIPSNNPLINYNYQKYPNLTTSNLPQSLAGLVISQRDRTNTNRNVTFIFPANASTPNPGAGSPTLLAQTNTSIESVTPYVGRQVY